MIYSKSATGWAALNAGNNPVLARTPIPLTSPAEIAALEAALSRSGVVVNPVPLGTQLIGDIVNEVFVGKLSLVFNIPQPAAPAASAQAAPVVPFVAPANGTPANNPVT